MLSETPGRFEYSELDVSSNFDLARRYQVNTVPTFVLLDGDGNWSISIPGLPSRSALEEEIDSL